MTKENSISVFLIAIFFIFLAYFVGVRDLSVGADTKNYADFFDNFGTFFKTNRFEPAFVYLTLFVSKITASTSLYFAILFLIFNTTMLLLYKRLSTKQLYPQDFLLIVGLMLLSSWYNVATINGLRQGLALPVLYLSLSLFSERRFFWSIILGLLAFNFHSSSALAFPFFLLVFFNDTKVMLIFLASALAYAAGITKVLLGTVSNIFNLTLYSDILEFGVESGNWIGFQADFFVYTVFWGVLFFVLRKYIPDSYYAGFSKVWRLYCTLMLPYFFFAHGGYSNRYALIGWLFLPILQAQFLSHCRISNMSKFAIGGFLFCAGLISYLLVLVGDKI